MKQLNFLLNMPMRIKDMGLIHQPTIKDIIEVGEEKLNKYLMCLSFDKGSIGDDEAELKELSNLEIVLSMADHHFKQTLSEAIKFFTKQEVHIFHEVNFIAVGDTKRLHKGNYDEFTETILAMFNRKRTWTDKSKQKELSNRQKEIYEKLNKYRQREREKETLELVDYINIVKHGGASYIDANTILEMTYYELMKCFEVILQKSNYEEYVMYKASPNYKIEKSVPHWTFSIKQNKKI